MRAADRAMRTLAAPTARRRSVISLTPLIDVVFILLVFFMLASSFMDWRTLSLDTAAAGEPAPAEEEPFVVAIHADELRLGGQRIDLATLIDRARARRPAAQPVSLQPMAETRVQAVVRVLDALNAAGVGPLKLVEDPDWQGDEALPATIDDLAINAERGGP